MASRKGKAVAALLALQFIDDCDVLAEKGKTRQWIKIRETSSYFQNILSEVSIEDFASVNFLVTF